MFIEFSDNYCSALKTQQKKDLWEPIENAYYANKNKYHFISCESRLCASELRLFAEEQGRHDIAKLFFTIEKNLTQLHNLKENLAIYSVIYPKPSLLKKKGKEIQLGVKEASKNEYWTRTCFVPENIDDDCFFRMIIDAKKEMKDSILCGLNYSYEPNNGGGSTTCETLKRIESENHFGFGILDSDFKDPTKEKKLGATADKVNKENFLPNIGFIILKIHEIENLFYSSSFIRKYTSGDTKQEIMEAHDLIKSVYPDYERFFDAKSGYTVQHAVNKYLFLSPILKLKKIDCVQHQSDKDNCFTCTNCQKYLIRGCAGEIKKGLKDDFYDAKEKKTFHINKLIPLISSSPDYIKQEWTRIFENTISWCCYSNFETRV